jgi:hypothetical protein
MSRLINFRALWAFFLRELHAATLNRFVYFFCGVSLLAGFVPLWADPAGGAAGTAAHTLLQASLYLVSLFALLTGVGSAQNEEEEQPFLMTQPVGRGCRVVSKFAALWLITGAATVLLVLPSIIAGAEMLWLLWRHAFGLGGVFVALGLAVGFSIGDRVKAHMTGLCVWLGLLVGSDLLALATAKAGLAESHPQAWLALLMANPLDALRIGVLLEIGRIPFEAESAPPLGRWWLTHLGLWFACLCTCWMLLSLAWSRFRLEWREF